LPTLPTPYVIAVISLAEDPEVRVTTNVVGCDPDAVHVGQEMRVCFEQHDDVWLPFFEPTGRTNDNPIPPAQRLTPRPPTSDERFEHRSVISGVGRSRLGRRLMVDPLSLTIDACTAAVADAGLTLDD